MAHKCDAQDPSPPPQYHEPVNAGHRPPTHSRNQERWYLCLEAVEHDDRIVFLHAVKDGAADRSYGLHVAALAGVPKQVIEHAQQRLLELENNDHHPEPAAAEQMTLFQSPAEHPLILALKDIDPDDLSPRQAQQALYSLKEQADQELHS